MGWPRAIGAWVGAYVVAVSVALAVGRLTRWNALDVLFLLGALLVLLSIGWMRTGTDTPLKWSYEGGIPRWLPAPDAREPPGARRAGGFAFGVGLLALGLALWGTIGVLDAMST